MRYRVVHCLVITFLVFCALADAEIVGTKKKGLKGRYLDLEPGVDFNRYRGALVILDPADLECVAADSCDSWSPLPYAIYDPRSETNDDSCFNDYEQNGGAAYDDAGDIFYWAEFVDADVATVHVYSVDEPAAPGDDDPGVVIRGSTMTGVDIQ